MPAATPYPLPLQGRLRSTDDHANGVTWAVQHSMTGEVWVLATGQPSDMFSGRPVPLGSTVALVGAWGALLHAFITCVAHRRHVPLGSTVAQGGKACWWVQFVGWAECTVLIW